MRLHVAPRCSPNDYGWWDDAYHAYVRRDEDWFYTNVGASVSETRVADLFAVVSPEGEVVFGWVIDDKNLAQEILTPDVIEGIRDLTKGMPVESLAARSAFLRYESPSHGYCRFADHAVYEQSRYRSVRTALLRRRARTDLRSPLRGTRQELPDRRPPLRGLARNLQLVRRQARRPPSTSSARPSATTPWTPPHRATPSCERPPPDRHCAGPVLHCGAGDRVPRPPDRNRADGKRGRPCSRPAPTA